MPKRKSAFKCSAVKMSTVHCSEEVLRRVVVNCNVKCSVQLKQENEKCLDKCVFAEDTHTLVLGHGFQDSKQFSTFKETEKPN